MTRAQLEAMLADVARPYAGMARRAIVAAIVASVSSVLLPGVSGWFLAGAAMAGAGGAAMVSGFNYLVPSALIRLLAIARTVSRYGERYWGHAAALRTLSGLRTALFRQLLPADDPRTVSAADSAARLAGDVDVLEERLVRRPSDAGALAAAAAGLAMAAAAGLRSVLALALVLAALPLVAWLVAPRLLDGRAQRAAAAAGRMKQAFVEQLPASAELAAFGLEQAAADAMAPLAAELDAARRSMARGEAMLGALAVAATGVAMVAVLLPARGSAPAIMLALLGAAAAMEAMGALTRSIARERAVRAALDRIAMLAGGAERGGAKVVGDILRIGPQAFGSGARVAVCGVSGSGKTRLLETLSGIRPAADADLAVDDVPLADCDRDALRAIFAVDPQGSEILAGTVRDNLAMARTGLTEAEMWEALEVACLASDVRGMADGLDSWLGDGGARLSGGQRKRLALARALAANRRWLVLDEPTEGLDAALEQELVERLDQWLARSGCGLLLASHRAAPLRLCDRRISLP